MVVANRSLPYSSFNFLLSLWGILSHIKLFPFQYHLRRASLTEQDAFAFLKGDSDGDYITYTDFCEALRQVFSGYEVSMFNYSIQIMLGEENN